ncbi:hypothetical protein BCR39DRAFT_558711 [Naematelia encephala]|uniref:Uncharacterized protein n=1 Tax=Naematelia encephala TaxID=71784 RepID=A0A1Y2B5S6_9TREE|nr:hypothetical protein BCR39DRAFT_558711 [Naematelia encephala]
MVISVLLVAIAWDQVQFMFGAEKAEEIITNVKAALTKDEENFKAAGVGYQFLEYSPEESMDRLEQVLQEKKWDGVCIGMGIRATKMFTPLFEALVNTIHEKSPGSRLLFNSGPSHTFEAVERWFPQARRKMD